LEILLDIEKLDKIYQKIDHFAPKSWAKIGLFLFRVLRKVVRCNSVVSFNYVSTVLAKALLCNQQKRTGEPG